jgi:serine/threonine protein kinase
MPSRLGRYAVRRRIGSGAFATVWLAYDEQLDSPVAVKVLADNWTEDQTVRQRFLEEGRFLRKVESPFVVSVYDAGELDDGRPYLVMSYADQGTLADRLEVEGLTPVQALEVVRQVGAGLQALHERGVLHRDVKPANVLFRTVEDSAERRVRAMVGDLGLGKALDMSSRLTVIAGTPSFVAPEQAQGEPLDPRADQYSLAALTFLLLSGRAPYSHASLAAAAAPGPPPPLSTPGRVFPAAVESVVRRGLSADREQRWPDVALYVEALAVALGPEAAAGSTTPWIPADPHLTQPGARPSSVPPARALPEPHPPPRRGRRVLLAALAVAALAAGVAGGWALGGWTDQETTVTDDNGALEVTVPQRWSRSVATDGWRPPGQDHDYPGLSAGSSADWAEDDTGHGVFVGLLPGDELPAQLPQHPECGEAGIRVGDDSPLGESATVVYSGCPGGYTVERVVQVTSDQLLWVQVRSADRATANRVLDDVGVHGM